MRLVKNVKHPFPLRIREREEVFYIFNWLPKLLIKTTISSDLKWSFIRFYFSFSRCKNSSFDAEALSVPAQLVHLLSLSRWLKKTKLDSLTEVVYPGDVVLADIKGVEFLQAAQVFDGRQQVLLQVQTPQFQ